MKHENVNRRDFSKWTMAAFGGFMSGAAIGCNGDATIEPTKTTDTSPEPSGEEETSGKTPHACRGLNHCKTAKNDCRGQGTCATEAWHHGCGEKNACKGQGGCGKDPITNDCKTKGGCQVPLMEHAWESARKTMEQRWTEADKEFGDAPPAKS